MWEIIQKWDTQLRDMKGGVMILETKGKAMSRINE